MGKKMTRREVFERREALSKFMEDQATRREQLKIKAKEVEARGLIGQTAGGAVGRAALMQARIDQVKTGLTLMDRLKPVLVWALIIFVVLGDRKSVV